jgi:hypothetical protein
LFTNLAPVCDCRHKKNEVFLDVVESVNLLVNSNGTLVLSEVWQISLYGPAEGLGSLSAAAAHFDDSTVKSSSV